MVEETMFKTMMQNSHNYTSLQRLCKVSLKCNELNPKKKKKKFPTEKKKKTFF